MPVSALAEKRSGVPVPLVDVVVVVPEVAIVGLLDIGVLVVVEVLVVGLLVVVVVLGVVVLVVVEYDLCRVIFLQVTPDGQVSE